MRYITDRKRAMGKGAAHSGTREHWFMSVSASGLAFMLPIWLYIFGSALGKDRAGVLEVFSQPFPAILTGLVLFVGMRHFAKGATMMVQDYARGSTLKVLVMLIVSVSYAVIATGLFALVKIAL